MIAVGLDVDRLGIRVAAVGGTARAPRLLAFFDQPFDHPPANEAELAALITALFERTKLPTDRLISALPTTSCLVRDLTVPFTRQDQIRDTLRFHAESVYHAVSIDEIVIQHLLVRPYDDRSQLLVIGAREQAVESHLRLLEHAGVDPVAVDLDVAALVNAVVGSKAVALKDKRVVVIDLAGSSLRLAVLDDGEVRTLRATRMQAAAVKVEEATARPRTLEDLRAGMLANESTEAYFAGSEDGILPVVILDEEETNLFDMLEHGEETRNTVLERIFVEIDRTLVRTPLSGEVDQVLLTGGGSAAEGLREAFANHFDCECAIFEPTSQLATKLGAKQKKALDKSGAVALGLALKGIGCDANSIDFRIGAFAFAGTFSRVRSGIANALVAGFVFFFMLAYFYQIVVPEELSNQREALTEYSRFLYQEAFRPEYVARHGELMKKYSTQPAVFNAKLYPSNMLHTFSTRDRTLKKKGGDDKLPQVISTLDIYRDFALATKASGRKVTFVQADLRQDTSTIHLIVDSDADVYAIKEQMAAGDKLATIISEQIDPEDGRFRVQLRLKTNKPDNRGQR